MINSWLELDWVIMAIELRSLIYSSVTARNTVYNYQAWGQLL